MLPELLFKLDIRARKLSIYTAPYLKSKQTALDGLSKLFQVNNVSILKSDLIYIQFTSADYGNLCVEVRQLIRGYGGIFWALIHKVLEEEFNQL